jgi:hypothetical protein
MHKLIIQRELHYRRSNVNDIPNMISPINKIILVTPFDTTTLPLRWLHLSIPLCHYAGYTFRYNHSATTLVTTFDTTTLPLRWLHLSIQPLCHYAGHTFRYNHSATTLVTPFDTTTQPLRWLHL